MADPTPMEALAVQALAKIASCNHDSLRGSDAVYRKCIKCGASTINEANYKTKS